MHRNSQGCELLLWCVSEAPANPAYPISASGIPVCPGASVPLCLCTPMPLCPCAPPHPHAPVPSCPYAPSLPCTILQPMLGCSLYFSRKMLRNGAGVGCAFEHAILGHYISYIYIANNIGVVGSLCVCNLQAELLSIYHDMQVYSFFHFLFLFLLLKCINKYVL